MSFRTLTRRQLTFDIVVPAALFAVLIIPYVHTGAGIVLLGMCATLVVWRLSPGLSLGIAWATAVVQMASGLNAEPVNLAVIVPLFASAAYGTRRVKWLGFASTFVGAATVTGYLVIVRREYSAYWDTVGFLFVSFCTLFLLSWTFGLLGKSITASRASRAAQVVAEEARRGAVQQSIVEQERTRIARDMHDVVAHSLAVVIAQADGARYARATAPEAVETSLTTIAATARAALADVRILLGQLRHSEGESPQPVLDDIGSLIEQFRGSGLSVRLDTAGEAAVLGAAQQIAVYRIMQEALTNALRHGDTTEPVTVDLTWTETSLTITITNSRGAPVPDHPVPGHGLVGMGERATLAGGTLTARGVDGYFVVRADLPVSPPAATTTSASDTDLPFGDAASGPGRRS